MDFLIYCREMWTLATQGEAQGIWFLAALYVLVVATYSASYQFRTRGWPKTRGELCRIGTEKFGATTYSKADQQYVSKALYKYTVSGIEYEGGRISPWIIVASHNARFVLQRQRSAVRSNPDGSVDVYYNPNKPAKSYLLVADPVGITVTVAIALAPLLLFFWKYHGY